LENLVAVGLLAQDQFMGEPQVEITLLGVKVITAVAVAVAVALLVVYPHMEVVGALGVVQE
jgi:hypothetical protein